MSHKLLLNANFHEFLIKIDLDLAAICRAHRCSCGGKLHVANYPRTPLGMDDNNASYYKVRISFCCSQCRKRTTSPSVRFMGRRRYPAPLALLLSMFRHKITEKRLLQIELYFGINISESTLKRWRRWWRIYFTTTTFWQTKRGCFSGTSILQFFPLDLIKKFSGNLDKKLVLLLRFLAPITAGFLRAV